MGKQLPTRSITQRISPWRPTGTVDNRPWSIKVPSGMVLNDIEEYMDEMLKKTIQDIRRKQQDIVNRSKEDEGECRPLRRTLTVSLGLNRVASRSAQCDSWSKTGLNMDGESLVLPEDEPNVLAQFYKDHFGAETTHGLPRLDSFTGTFMTGKRSDTRHGMHLPLTSNVVKAYTRIGQNLSQLWSEELPKSVEILPALANWDEVINLTTPEAWTPKAVLGATRVFCAYPRVKLAQQFVTRVVLGHIQHPSRTLDPALYQALVHVIIHRPSAFLYGIILPLCEMGCSLNESAVVGAILVSHSVPMMHAAETLTRITALSTYVPAHSVFVRLLVQKHQSYSFSVVSSVFKHFASVISDTRTMPVVWHQALLAFVQHHRDNLVQVQRNLLLDLIQYKHHPAFSPVIQQWLLGRSALSPAGMTDLPSLTHYPDVSSDDDEGDDDDDGDDMDICN